jgi:hypothetical protein
VYRSLPDVVLRYATTNSRLASSVSEELVTVGLSSNCALYDQNSPQQGPPGCGKTTSKLTFVYFDQCKPLMRLFSAAAMYATTTSAHCDELMKDVLHDVTSSIATTAADTTASVTLLLLLLLPATALIHLLTCFAMGCKSEQTR